jgi:battenin
VSVTESETSAIQSHQVLTVTEKLKSIPPLLVYMIPLGLVYLFEYFINQGLVSKIRGFHSDENLYCGHLLSLVYFFEYFIDIQYYNFACGSVWVRNLVSDTKGGT